uniref:Uncharacterized protein n=1 Tax=Timema poppense TaxID=170557 RepID=A0A7R9DM57_TIMPO|nr:unnamed protein product [Timema poppensis]
MGGIYKKYLQMRIIGIHWKEYKRNQRLVWILHARQHRTLFIVQVRRENKNENTECHVIQLTCPLVADIAQALKLGERDALCYHSIYVDTISQKKQLQIT